MAGLKLRPRVSGLAPAVSWLRDHDVSVKRIAGLLGITELHARQLAFRGSRVQAKVSDPRVS